MIDDVAEELALAAFVQSKLAVRPEWFTGVRLAVALVFQQRGAPPASEEVAALWLKERGIEWPGMAVAFSRQLPVLDGLAEGLGRLAARRGLVQVAPEIARLGQLGGDDLAGEAHRLVGDALAPLSGRQTGVFDEVRALIAGEVSPGWPILWTPVFSKIVGNVGPDYMMSVGGLPGAGKTVWALQTALDLARQGIKTVYCSADMGAGRIVTRAVSSLSGVSYRALRSGALSAYQRELAGNALDELQLLPFSCFSTCNVCQVAADARIDGWQALFFDFIQKARVPGVSSQADMVLSATRVLSALVGKTFVCLVSQRDQHEDRLKWSSAMEEDSDVVVLLDRDDEIPIVRTTVKKNRDGTADAVVPYYFYFPTIRLVELSKVSVGFDV